jgi:hypothetical protein
MTQAWTLRLLAVTTIALAIGGSTGCTVSQGIQNSLAYNDAMNDFVLGWRNESWAKRTWREKRPEYGNQPFLDDFGKGFVDGYIAAAAGGAQCSPALPPRRYWSWKYQTAEGQGKTAAWYAGYPLGAQAAEEEGAHLWGDIQISESLRQEYELGHEAPYPYPVSRYNAEECCPQIPVDGQIVPLDGIYEVPGHAVPIEGLPHNYNPDMSQLPAAQPVDVSQATPSGLQGPRISRLGPVPR